MNIFLTNGTELVGAFTRRKCCLLDRVIMYLDLPIAGLQIQFAKDD